MTTLMSLASLIALAGPAPADLPASSWELASGRLISELALPSVPGFDLGQEIAVVVIAPFEPSLEGRLGARLRGHLMQLGLQALALASTGAPEALFAQARAQGAEWMLRVELTPEPRAQAHLELLWLEPEGLWAPAPRAPASLALLTLPLSDTLTPRPPPGPPPPPPGPPPPSAPPSIAVPGPAFKAHSWSEPVLGLTACPEAQGPDSLAVLTERRLLIVTNEGGHLQEAEALSLDTLEPAPIVTRDRVGQVVCNQAFIAFAHVGLNAGYVVPRRQPRAPWRAVAGVPHGLRDDGAVLLSAHTAGTNLYETPPVWVDAQGAQSSAQGAWPVAWFRAWSGVRAPAWQAFSLGPNGAVGGLTPPFEPKVGYGSQAVQVADQLLIVRTAPTALRGHDEVQVFDYASAQPVGPVIAVDGEVQASTLLQGADEQLFIALVATRAHHSDLLLLKVQVRP